MKRVFDILISLLAIIALMPFMIPIIIILKLTGEHYVFYYQQRVGQYGKEFRMIKFSTMLLDSPAIGTGEITIKKDPRVFAFGRFLRIAKINEMPQLLNILKGDMSIVGPRPLTPKHFQYYTQTQQSVIKQLKPGLTGVGAIIFRDEEQIFSRSDLSHEQTYKQRISPYKAELELWYLNNTKFWLDIKIIFLTIWVIFFKRTKLPFRVLKGLPEKPASL